MPIKRAHCDRCLSDPIDGAIEGFASDDTDGLLQIRDGGLKPTLHCFEL